MPKRTEGRCIEGNQRGTGTLCTGYTHDGRMQQCGGGFFSGDKALHRLCSVGRRRIIVCLPCSLNGRVLIDKKMTVVGGFVAKD